MSCTLLLDLLRSDDPDQFRQGLEVAEGIGLSRLSWRIRALVEWVRLVEWARADVAAVFARTERTPPPAVSVAAVCCAAETEPSGTPYGLSPGLPDPAGPWRATVERTFSFSPDPQIRMTITLEAPVPESGTAIKVCLSGRARERVEVLAFVEALAFGDCLLEWGTDISISVENHRINQPIGDTNAGLPARQRQPLPAPR